MDGYIIKTNSFEGPFDLLLFFIERDELDIHDIPIAKITDDFLAHLRLMDELNIELASEFVLVAATLVRIKAKMLLPRKDLDEAGNEIDPREDLKQRLIEYKKYVNILDEMRQLEEDRSHRNYRGNTSYEMRQIANKALVDIELESLTLYRLFKTFQGLLHRYEDAQREVTVHTIQNYNYTIEEQREYIIDHLTKKGKSSFTEMFSSLKSRIHAIVTFLSLLELLNLQKVSVTQGIGTNNFWISAVED